MVRFILEPENLLLPGPVRSHPAMANGHSWFAAWLEVLLDPSTPCASEGHVADRARWRLVCS